MHAGASHHNEGQDDLANNVDHCIGAHLERNLQTNKSASQHKRTVEVSNHEYEFATF